MFSNQDLKKLIVPLFLEQLLMASVLLSVSVSAVILLTNESLMRLMFGKVDADVMDACVTYLRISAYSCPALVSVAMGPVFITVIGQCMGANDIEQAEFYFNVLQRSS